MTKQSKSYDKPKLRARIKDKVQAQGKGGKPGQWSARKAQLLAHDYEKAGGGYTKGPSKEQKSLKSWTKQEWTTDDGGPSRRGGGTKRYLPKGAWEKLTPKQKAQANASKQKGTADGKQFVDNPAAAKAARQKASDGHGGGTKRKTSGRKKTSKKAGKKSTTAAKSSRSKTTKKSASHRSTKKTSKKARSKATTKSSKKTAGRPTKKTSSHSSKKAAGRKTTKKTPGKTAKKTRSTSKKKGASGKTTKKAPGRAAKKTRSKSGGKKTS